MTINQEPLNFFKHVPSRSIFLTLNYEAINSVAIAPDEFKRQPFHFVRELLQVIGQVFDAQVKLVDYNSYYQTQEVIILHESPLLTQEMVMQCIRDFVVFLGGYSDPQPLRETQIFYWLEHYQLCMARQENAHELSRALPQKNSLKSRVKKI